MHLQLNCSRLAILDPLLKRAKMYHWKTRQFAHYNNRESLKPFTTIGIWLTYSYNRYTVTQYHTIQRLMLKLNDVVFSLFGCF